MVRKWLVMVWLVVFFGGSAVSCTNREDAWLRIQETKVLRVGLDPTYPPFEQLENDRLVGLDVDLAQAIATDLGLTAEFVYFGYDGLYDALATEQVDVLISALVVAPERGRDFAFSEPYFNAGQILIVPQAEKDIEDMRDLNGRILAVELGAQGHVEAITWQRQLPEMDVQPYNTADEALTAVATGKADAALVDAVSGRLFIRHEPSLRRLPTPVTVEPYAIVTRIEDRLLLENINQSLETLQQTGKLDTIITHWLDN
ncbi:MAG: amino acid ABC transporter substrate-binding protein [Chloroflexi bacterium]|nr:MAG: amino acid ABC transporter substrate-binding protein [Chloroflexota bacterium]